MAKTLGNIAQEIRETDKKIVEELHKRLKLSKEFYQREAEDKVFHEELESTIKTNMFTLAKNAKIEAKLVEKFYNQITKHAKQHKKTVKKALLEQLKKVR